MSDRPAKKQDDGLPGWVMTFADLMSLLMCFFVLLLSFSEIDVLKFKQLSGSMSEAFGVQREVKVKETPKGVNVIVMEFSAGRPDPTPLNVVRQNTTSDLKQYLDMSERRFRISREGEGEMMNQGGLQGDEKQYALEQLEDIQAHEKQTAEKALEEANKELEKAKLELENAAFYEKSSAQELVDKAQKTASDTQEKLEEVKDELKETQQKFSALLDVGEQYALKQLKEIYTEDAKEIKEALEEANKELEKMKAELEDAPFYEKPSIQKQVDETQEVIEDVQEELEKSEQALEDAQQQLDDSQGEGKKYILDKPEDIQTYERLKKLQENVADIKEALKSEIESGAVEVETNQLKIIIRIKEKASFSSARAELRGEFLPILGRIAGVLEKARGKIVVAGHTDDIPINNQRFRSNWELSAARAVSVVHALLAASTLPADRLLVEGYADTLPLVPNVSWGNRSRNRRVEIVLEQGDMEFIDEGALIDTGLDDLIENNPYEMEDKGVMYE